MYFVNINRPLIGDELHRLYVARNHNHADLILLDYINIQARAVDTMANKDIDDALLQM